MVKFIFLQPYTIRVGNISITSGGATGGTIIKSFNTGDIIEGVKKSMSAGQPNLPPIVAIETVVDGKTYAIADFLVKEYTAQLNTYINSGSQNNTGTSTPDNKATTTTNNTKTTTDNTKFVWTPIKKLVAGALIIGVIYGILKLTKVI